MRITRYEILRQPDLRKDFPGEFVGFAPFPGYFVQQKRRGDDGAHRLARIKRREGILENDLEITPQGPHLVIADRCYVAPGKVDCSAVRLQQADEGAAQR